MNDTPSKEGGDISGEKSSKEEGSEEGAGQDGSSQEGTGKEGSCSEEGSCEKEGGQEEVAVRLEALCLELCSEVAAGEGGSLLSSCRHFFARSACSLDRPRGDRLMLRIAPSVLYHCLGSRVEGKGIRVRRRNAFCAVARCGSHVRVAAIQCGGQGNRCDSARGFHPGLVDHGH